MNALGLQILKSFESCRLTPYQDVGGVWTVGFGATGEDVTPGVVWTQYEADTRLISDLAVRETEVRSLLTVALDDDQVSALVDFCYNEGFEHLKTSTLLSKINSGDFNVEVEFKKWIYAGGEMEEGLVARRAAEACLFTSDYHGVEVILDARG